MTAPALRWTPARPNALVIACSDGRLQEATDAFLAREFKITRYDRFYVPGGGGALASSGTDPVRAQQMCAECKYLVDLHAVRRVIALFHGPSAAGRIEAACGGLSAQASVGESCGAPRTAGGRCGRSSEETARVGERG